MLVFSDSHIKVYAVLTEKSVQRDSSRRTDERKHVEELLREAFGEPAPKLTHKENGSPVLNIPGVAISITHCPGCVAIAVSEKHRHIGIDAESSFRTGQLQRVARKFLSSEQLPEWHTPDKLLQAWTIKEATYKALSMDGLNLNEIPLPDEMPGTTVFNNVSIYLQNISIDGFDDTMTIAYTH